MCPASWSIWWWAEMRRGLLIALMGAVVLSAGCGFRLQGQSSWPQQWHRYLLDYPARDPAMVAFVDLLEESLGYRGLINGGEPAVRIELRSLRDGKTIAAIGGDGKAVEFELQRALAFQLHTANWSSSLFELSSSRRLSFDPSVVLAKEAEEDQLRLALSRDLIELLILRAEAELRAVQVPR